MEVVVRRSLVVQLLPLVGWFQLPMEHTYIQWCGTPLLPFPVMPPQLFPWALPVNPQGLQTALVNDNSAKVSAGNNSDTSTTPPSVINVETAGGTGEEEHDSSDFEELEDWLSLLDELEANQFKDFDPRVAEETSWKPPAPMLHFLEKQFNPAESLTPTERKKILDDSPCLTVMLSKFRSWIRR